MTSDAHQRASDRVAEAAEAIDANIVVMVQGDEPMITPDMISSAVHPMLADSSINFVNLAKRIDTESEYMDPNTIKVVMDSKWDALYFSREPIPTNKILNFGEIPVFKQVCIIPFRHEFLQTYYKLAPTSLEISESVDMLRCIEHGYRVRMVETDVSSHAVDNKDDLALVERIMLDDPWIALYPTRK